MHQSRTQTEPEHKHKKKGEHQHHGHAQHIREYWRRLWVSLALTLPVLALSEQIQI
ncbi:MAG: hypothetical protein ACTSW4_00545 [Candidatus Ranarchaeia archaeon]